MSRPPTGSSPLHAAGSIAAAGTSGTALHNMSVPSGAHTTGIYPLTVDPIDAAECVILVSFRGAAGLDHTAEVTHTSDTVKTVTVQSNAPADADQAFDILIMRTKVGA